MARSISLIPHLFRLTGNVLSFRKEYSPPLVLHLDPTKALVTAPIILPPDWSLPFEIMCDASDYAVGAVLGQCKDKQHNAISYASKTLTGP